MWLPSSNYSLSPLTSSATPNEITGFYVDHLLQLATHSWLLASSIPLYSSFSFYIPACCFCAFLISALIAGLPIFMLHLIVMLVIMISICSNAFTTWDCCQLVSVGASSSSFWMNNVFGLLNQPLFCNYKDSAIQVEKVSCLWLGTTVCWSNCLNFSKLLLDHNCWDGEVAKLDALIILGSDFGFQAILVAKHVWISETCSFFLEIRMKKLFILAFKILQMLWTFLVFYNSTKSICKWLKG